MPYRSNIEVLEEEHSKWLEENCKCDLVEEGCSCIDFHDWLESMWEESADNHEEPEEVASW